MEVIVCILSFKTPPEKLYKDKASFFPLVSYYFFIIKAQEFLVG